MSSLPTKPQSAPTTGGGFAYLFPDGDADERVGLGPSLSALADGLLPDAACPEDARAVQWFGGLLARAFAAPRIRSTPAEDDRPVLALGGNDLVPLDRTEVMEKLVNRPVPWTGAPPMMARSLQSLVLDEMMPALCLPEAIERVNQQGCRLYATMLDSEAGRETARAGARPVPVEFAFALAGLAWAGGGCTDGASALLRAGYRLAVPTAQAALTALAQVDGEPLQSLQPEDLTRGPVGGIVRDAGFDNRTPLWFYLLREAEEMGEGLSLGPLGSRLLAETLTGLFAASPRQLRLEDPGSIPAIWAFTGEPKAVGISLT